MAEEKALNQELEEPAWDEELRCWLENYVTENPHQPTAVLSRAQFIGVSRKALDAYIAGKYFLPKEAGGEGVDAGSSRIESAIHAFRERVEGTPRHGYNNTFVETRCWYQVEEAIRTAINENVIVVIYGKPGVGKSRSLVEYAIRKMSTSPILILCSPNITTRYFVQRIAQELKVIDTLSISGIEDKIAEKLRRYPRPIFVDQANYLRESGLGSICYIWETARVPIVLAGTHTLHRMFTTSRVIEDVREQLSSRVAIYYLLSELTLPEAKAIIQHGLGSDATDEIVAQIINVTGGIHRQIDMIIPRILELKNRNQQKLANGNIQMRDIVTAASTKMRLVN